MAERPNVAEWGKGYAKVVAQAWSDEAYKERLLRDPRSVLTEAGLAVPSSVEITVVEDSAEKRHLVLPPKPAEEEVTEEALAGVAAGGYCDYGCWCDTYCGR
jgi:hypothetical protein